MTNNPLVTVTLIAMNHEKFIAQACYSILNQTYNNIEVIFLDNNSKDKTFEIGNEILKNSGIKYLGIKNQENKGVSANLNIQVNHATGEFISILSGDDWYEKKNIEMRLKYLQQNNWDVVFSDGYKYIEEQKKRDDVYSSKRKKKVKQNIEHYFKENIAGNITSNVGFFTKKNILLENPFDEKIHAEDWDINLRLSQKGYRFGFVDLKLFNYRILSTSLSNNFEMMKNSYFEITNKYITEIKESIEASKIYQMRLFEFEIHKLELIKNKSNNERQDLISAYTNFNSLRYKSPKKEYKNTLIYIKTLFGKI
ncbi:MAG: glycosyltransferase [Flavobacteriaceae bacterium]|nr:glycosyltransferase [Flavobacteriaceae bacterium]